MELKTRTISSRFGRGSRSLQADEHRSTSKRAIGRVTMVLLSLLLSATMVVGVQPVCAQDPIFNPMERRFNNMNQQTVARTDVDSIIETVIGSPDDPITEIVENMFMGYTVAWREQAMHARVEIKRIREESSAQGEPALEALRAQMDERQRSWREEARALEERFIEDVKSVLSDEQQSRWKIFERDRFRRLSLRPRSRLAGEGLDLFNVIDEIELPDAFVEEMAESLDEYAWQLDAALKARESVADDVDEQMQSGNPNIDAEALFRMLLPQRQAVRDLNVKYVDVLADQLPADWAATLRHEFNLQRFPRIHAATEADEYFEIVRELSDLAENQSAAVDSIESSYESSLARINAELIQIHLKREEGIPIRFRMKMETRLSENDGSTSSIPGNSASGDGSGGSVVVAQTSDQHISTSQDENLDAERALWQQRRDLVQETIEKVHGVLNPDQRTRAPMDEVMPGLGRGHTMPTGPHESAPDESGNG